MRLNNKKVIKLEGDASERKFYRSKNSIIIFSKKNKKKNLLIYDAINRILNSSGIKAPRLLKNNYKVIVGARSTYTDEITKNDVYFIKGDLRKYEKKFPND